MLTCEQLIFVIISEYPGLVHGQDFLAGHPFDAAGKQNGEAFILQWAATAVEQPDVNAIIALWPKYEAAYIAQGVRSQRDYRLRQCDWSQAADVPVALREKYLAYRQALRDVPQQPGFPQTIEWPMSPDS